MKQQTSIFNLSWLLLKLFSTIRVDLNEAKPLSKINPCCSFNIGCRDGI